jgi:hypothetical protein
MMLMNLGSAALTAGDLDASKPLFSRALRIARQIDDRVAQYDLVDAPGARPPSPRLGHPRSMPNSRPADA